MSKVINDMAARCELALMGKVVTVCNDDEVQLMTEYLLNAMGRETSNLVNILEQSIRRYNSENEVKYLVCNTVMDMKCITYLIDTHDGETPAPFAEDYGSGYPASFCYVFNTESDWCSEFGDCFFEKQSDGYYHRVS